jgi:hypothetical protein
VYSKFSEEYLKQEYNPNLQMYKYAINNYNLKPEIFEKQDDVLTKKEKLQKQLFMRAYEEIQKSKKEIEQ